MGLTIHYRLSMPVSTTSEQVKEIFTALGERAKKLDFAEVKEVVELHGIECNPEFHRGKSEALHWLTIQAQDYRDNSPREHIIAVSTHPGEGCESANFGLCRSPKTHEWSWHSFCKTQYASSVSTQHFIKCHAGVCTLLDFLKTKGVTVEVSDEGEFYENRDFEALAKEVGGWNEMIAAFVGKMKDTFAKEGDSFDAPITEHPEFEHLEAKGQDKFNPQGKKNDNK